ncbi:MAG: hypothetical protein L0211_09110 [Planctomycetaceae bacterium]|nr:hypothetical protein [Planctomycetaceae bacterium]
MTASQIIIRCFAADRGWTDFNNTPDNLSEAEQQAICRYESATEADAAAELDLSEDLAWAVQHAWEKAARKSAIAKLEARAGKSGRYSVACHYRKTGSVSGSVMYFADESEAQAYLLVAHGDPRDYSNRTSSFQASVIDHEQLTCGG